MFCKGTWQRAILVILLWILVIGAAAVAMVFSFRIASERGQIYIVVNDGLVNRASYIVKRSEKEEEYALELYEYFMPAWLERDRFLQSDPYMDFSVSNYDYTVEISKIDVKPWSTRATAEVRELMSRIEAIPMETQSVAEAKTAPIWEAHVYQVHLVKAEDADGDDARWYINDMTVIPSEGE